MNLLVTGGTGFIGSHVVRELLALYPDAPIRILTRRLLTGNPWGRRVTFVQANVTAPATLPPAVAGMDAVVHCVQFPNHPVEDPARGWTYLEVDGKGTKNLVEACKRAGVRRFVYFSGAGVSKDKTQSWFRAKSMAEDSIRASGMEYVIFRPSWVYGPEDRSLNKFVSFTRYLPFVPVIGNGRVRIQPISVFDVARVSALAVSKPEATNKVFDLGGPQELSLDQVARTVRRVLGTRRMLVHHPVVLMKFVAGLMSVLPNPPLSPSAIDFILTETRVDPRPAEEIFGVRFESLESGLRRYL